MEANVLTRSTSFIAYVKRDTMERYVKLILTSVARKIATIKRLIYVPRVRAKTTALVSRERRGSDVNVRLASTDSHVKSTSTNVPHNRALRAQHASMVLEISSAYVHRVNEAKVVRFVSIH